LSHHPESSGRAIHGEVDGWDIGKQHGQRFDLVRHTHKPQKQLETSNTCVEAVDLGPQLISQEFLFRVVQSPDVRLIIPSVYLQTIENWCKAPVKSSASLFQRGPWPLRPNSGCVSARCSQQCHSWRVSQGGKCGFA